MNHEGRAKPSVLTSKTLHGFSVTGGGRGLRPGKILILAWRGISITMDGSPSRSATFPLTQSARPPQNHIYPNHYKYRLPFAYIRVICS